MVALYECVAGGAEGIFAEVSGSGRDDAGKRIPWLIVKRAEERRLVGGLEEWVV